MTTQLIRLPLGLIVMRFAVSAFALIFVLAGAGLISTEAKAGKDVYKKAPTSANHRDFPRWAGYAIGTAHLCRRYGQRFLDDNRIKRIEKHLKGNPDFDRQVERSRHNSRGVDTYTNLRPYCDATDDYMDVIITALANEPAAPKNPNSSAGGIVFHATLTEDGDPRNLFHSLTIGEMPATMYIRNAYDNLEQKRQVRYLEIYNPEGALLYTDIYAFTPNDDVWYVWHYFNPADIFNKLGKWRVETRIKGKNELTSSREIEVHSGN